MDFNCYNSDFWSGLDNLIEEAEIIIDRRKGTSHPDYPDFIYPVDYGYLKGTRSGDGAEIDVWVGSEKEKTADSILVTLDFQKKDSEIKILLGCNTEEKKTIYREMNLFSMNALFIERR